MSADPPETFGDLRSLTQRPPTSARWELICEALERWPDPVERDEVILPYLLGVARRWPAEILEAPQRWVEALLEGQPPAALRLARSLTLQGRWLGARGARALASAAELEHAHALHLYGNELDAAAIRALLAPPSWLRQLRTLHLYKNTIGDAGAHALGESASLGHLTELRLRHAELGPVSLAHLREMPAWTELQLLDLSDNPLGPEGAELLAELLPSSLVELHLSSTGVGAEGAHALASATAPLEQLRALGLNFLHIRDEALEVLLGSRAGASLERLELAQNGLTDRAAALLARSPRARSLRHVSLFGNLITDEGARALARSPHLAGLERLRLEKNRIGERGWHALATSEHLARELKRHFRDYL